MRSLLYFLCFLWFFISCSPIIEKNITMRDFNKKIIVEKKKLKNPIYIELIYNPKINVHVNKQSGLFLNNIDSLYVENIQNKIIEELKKVNILVTNNISNFSLSVNEIIMIEKNVEGTNSDSEDTIESELKLSINGYLYDKSKRKRKFIESLSGTTTRTGMSFFTILFNDSDFDAQKNDTFEKGLVEKNLIKLFAIKCAENI